MMTERVMGDWGLPLVLSSLLSLPATSTACKTLERAGCVIQSLSRIQNALTKGVGLDDRAVFCMTMTLFYVLLWVHV